jgi:HD-like signal output (HDOD) protein
MKPPHPLVLRAEDTSVPVLPQGLQYLVSALGDDKMSMRELASVLQRFPSIAARVISVANSAWVSPQTPVTTLSGACAILGWRVVQGLSVALAVAKRFNAVRCPAFDAHRFWITALLTAEGAVLLPSHLGTQRDPNTLNTAGLLHNLGLLFMADRWPRETTAALEASNEGEDLGLVEALRATSGTDYCAIGGELGEAWKLPGPLTQAMRHHRDPGYRGSHWQIALSVGVAASMAAVLWRGAKWESEDPRAAALEMPLPAVEAAFSQLATKRDVIEEWARQLFV